MLIFMVIFGDGGQIHLHLTRITRWCQDATRFKTQCSITSTEGTYEVELENLGKTEAPESNGKLDGQMCMSENGVYPQL
jgi:hypothetical protein